MLEISSILRRNSLRKLRDPSVQTQLSEIVDLTCRGLLFRDLAILSFAWVVVISASVGITQNFQPTKASRTVYWDEMQETWWESELATYRRSEQISTGPLTLHFRADNRVYASVPGETESWEIFRKNFAQSFSGNVEYEEGYTEFQRLTLNSEPEVSGSFARRYGSFGPPSFARLIGTIFAPIFFVLLTITPTILIVRLRNYFLANKIESKLEGPLSDDSKAAVFAIIAFLLVAPACGVLHLLSSSRDIRLEPGYKEPLAGTDWQVSAEVDSHRVVNLNESIRPMRFAVNDDGTAGDILDKNSYEQCDLSEVDGTLVLGNSPSAAVFAFNPGFSVPSKIYSEHQTDLGHKFLAWSNTILGLDHFWRANVGWLALIFVPHIILLLSAFRAMDTYDDTRYRELAKRLADGDSLSSNELSALNSHVARRQREQSQHEAEEDSRRHSEQSSWSIYSPLSSTNESKPEPQKMWYQ